MRRTIRLDCYQTIIINQSGYYELTSDITNFCGDYYIYINASDVILDGKNHTIDGVGWGTAILLEDNVRNITIKNIRLRDWVYGIQGSDCELLRIENTMIEDIKYGVWLWGSIYSLTLVNNTISNSECGVDLGVGLINITITNNTFIENTLDLQIYGDMSSIEITNNSFSSGMFLIGGYRPPHIDVFANNTIHGKPIVYLDSKSNITIESAG